MCSTTPLPGCPTIATSWLSWCPRERARLQPRPARPSAPTCKKAPVRLSQMATFQDMLTNPHDEDLFEHFATSQIARIDTETGEIKRIGTSRADHGRRSFARREIPARANGPSSVLLSRAVFILHAESRGLGHERPEDRHDRRPACLRRRSSPGCADRPSLRKLAAAARRPARSGPRPSTAAIRGKRSPIATRSWRSRPRSPPSPAS